LQDGWALHVAVTLVSGEVGSAFGEDVLFGAEFEGQVGEALFEAPELEEVHLVDVSEVG
jgi:hypothetical protein